MFKSSIETAYRLHESDPNTMLPKIPCHPIGYGVAKTLMRYGVDHTVKNVLRIPTHSKHV